MNELLFLGNLGTGEIVIIAIVVLLLFGGKKIPDIIILVINILVSMGAKIQFVMNSSLIIPNLLPLHRLKKLKLEKN